MLFRRREPTETLRRKTDNCSAHRHTLRMCVYRRQRRYNHVTRIRNRRKHPNRNPMCRRHLSMDKRYQPKQVRSRPERTRRIPRHSRPQWPPNIHKKDIPSHCPIRQGYSYTERPARQHVKSTGILKKQPLCSKSMVACFFFSMMDNLSLILSIIHPKQTTRIPIDPNLHGEKQQTNRACSHQGTASQASNTHKEVSDKHHQQVP